MNAFVRMRQVAMLSRAYGSVTFACDGSQCLGQATAQQQLSDALIQ